MYRSVEFAYFYRTTISFIWYACKVRNHYKFGWLIRYLLLHFFFKNHLHRDVRVALFGRMLDSCILKLSLSRPGSLRVGRTLYLAKSIKIFILTVISEESLHLVAFIISNGYEARYPRSFGGRSHLIKKERFRGGGAPIFETLIKLFYS